jgi:DNA-binding transcriptional LysR family regulator
MAPASSQYLTIHSERGRNTSQLGRDCLSPPGEFRPCFVLLEIFRLKVFRAVAKHLSFRKAGEVLYLTQPAVTLQIKALEDELGTKLFERSAHGVQVTEACKLLLQYPEQMHQLANEAERRLAALNGEIAGDMILGASTTIALHVLPRYFSLILD